MHPRAPPRHLRPLRRATQCQTPWIMAFGSIFFLRPPRSSSLFRRLQASSKHGDHPNVFDLSSRIEAISHPPRLLVVVINSSKTEIRRHPRSSLVMLRLPVGHHDLSNTIAHARSAPLAHLPTRLRAAAPNLSGPELRPPPAVIVDVVSGLLSPSRMPHWMRRTSRSP